MTYAQLIPPFSRDIAWVRVYANRRDTMNCMNKAQIRESLAIYGEKTVRRVLPGYNFLLVWLEE